MMFIFRVRPMMLTNIPWLVWNSISFWNNGHKCLPSPFSDSKFGCCSTLDLPERDYLLPVKGKLVFSQSQQSAPFTMMSYKIFDRNCRLILLMPFHLTDRFRIMSRLVSHFHCSNKKFFQNWAHQTSEYLLSSICALKRGKPLVLFSQHLSNKMMTHPALL